MDELINEISGNNNIKANMLLAFGEYINDIYKVTVESYDENSASKLREDIVGMLTCELDECLTNGVESEVDVGTFPLDFKTYFKSYMKLATKDYLIDRLKKGQLGLQDFIDENSSEVFNDFNDLEQKVWLMNAIYNISGYNRADKESKEANRKEICEVLGISRLKYLRTTLGIGLHSLKFIRKIKEDMMSQMFNDNPVYKKTNE